MKPSPDIFRAYDIRGVVETVLTPEVVRTIGQAVASLYPQSPRVAVGRDGRLSSAELAQALSEGLMAAGRTVIDIGEVPTPVLYYATHELDTQAGIMITGSHNPPEYNGLKLVMDGKTLFGESIRGIHDHIVTGDLASGSGHMESVDLQARYIDRVCRDVELDRSLDIAIDCGNGVAGPMAHELFERLGCTVTALYCDIDGRFPNHHPNPSDPKNLTDLINHVTDNGLELGLAFDGDGDRLGVIDDRGEVLWADRQMMLFAADVLGRNPGAEIIYDVKSSRHLADTIREHGGKPFMWKTGHSFIKTRMQESGALLAGEMSGHIFFKERWYGFDDGLYAAARLLEILSTDPRASSAIFAQLPTAVSTPEINIHFDQDGAQHTFMQAFVEQADFPDADQLTDIDGLRVDYPQGWGLVRASNTTPSIVIRFEADSEASLEQLKLQFRGQLLAVEPDLAVPF